MSQEATISGQLRRRRKALGLSLSEVARRVGTSPATLSRYENGWTRFELYTLRKLATALACDLRVELLPARPPVRRVSRKTLTQQLRRLFWDHDLKTSDLDNHRQWVVERVLDYGNLADVRALISCLGRRNFTEIASKADRLSPRTQSFWRQVLEKEGVPCTKKSSRNTAWIS